MPEGEKHWGPVLIGGDNLPSSVQIGLTDVQKNSPGPSGSGITVVKVNVSDFSTNYAIEQIINHVETGQQNLQQVLVTSL